MIVKNLIEDVEKDLTRDELITLLSSNDRQIDLIFRERKIDEDGHVWNAENWVCIDGRRFIRSYFFDGRASSDFSGYNIYDLAGNFLPEEAVEIRLN